MRDPLNWVGAFCFVGCLLVLLADHFQDRTRDRLIESFRNNFPGERCKVCALHRYGLKMGFEAPGSDPIEHDDCPERDEERLRWN